MQKLVLFDVDNTIIKGNLTTLICGKALQASSLNYISWLRLLFNANKIMHQTFLIDIERALIEQNLLQLDQHIQTHVNKCYQLLFSTLQKAKLTGAELIAHAETFFSQDQWIERFCYQKALQTIEATLADPGKTLILISGGLEIFLQILLKKLEKYFQKKNILQKQIYGFGSSFQTDAPSKILVGIKKAELIKQYQSQLIDPSIVSNVYSDNRYFADLPLLQMATKKAVIIDEPSIWYNLLPRSSLRHLIFDPAWKNS